MATAVLASLSFLEMELWARTAPYSGDELINLHAIETFYAELDYTTETFGGYPFDPAVSSGVLVTWFSGLLRKAGADLYWVRLGNATLLALTVTGLAFAALRRLSVPVATASAIATAAWFASLPLLSNEQRITNPGELWSFVYLAAGAFFVRTQPALAALAWGAAVWWGKIVYLPFAGPLAVVLLAAHADEPRGRARRVATIAAAFVAPLLAWATLIAVRYDVPTLVEWVQAYVAFVAKHGFDVAQSYVGSGRYQGWAFAPHWPETGSVFDLGWWVRLRGGVPLAVGTAAVALWWTSGAARRHSRAERWTVATAAAMTLPFTAWFLLADATQWSRHLLPALYVSAALAFLVAIDVWFTPAPPKDGSGIRTTGQAPRRIVLAASVAALVCSWAYVSDALDDNGWRASYAKLCTAEASLRDSPCTLGDAAALESTIAASVCPGANLYDPADTCRYDRRREFLKGARSYTNEHPGDRFAAWAAAYLIVSLQDGAYGYGEEFDREIPDAVCGAQEPRFFEALKTMGIDVEAIRARCNEFTGNSQQPS